MRIETKLSNPGELFVYFETEDFRLKVENGKELWFEAKEEIKSSLPYPVAKWDPSLGCWIVKDSEENRKILEGIKRKYFEDKNQVSLEI